MWCHVVILGLKYKHTIVIQESEYLLFYRFIQNSEFQIVGFGTALRGFWDAFFALLLLDRFLAELLWPHVQGFEPQIVSLPTILTLPQVQVFLRSIQWCFTECC